MRKPMLIFIFLGVAGCGAGKTDGAKAAPDTTADSQPEPAQQPELASTEPVVDDSRDQRDTDADDTADAPKEVRAEPPPGPLAATETESLLKITIVDNKGRVIPGVIVTVENSKGVKFISRESDENGFMELLVPKGDTYVARFVSLDENEVVKQIPMPDKPFITANFELIHTPSRTRSFVLKGVFFDTAKWNLKPESYPNLENLLEFMTLKKSAYIRLEGHTDSVGDDRANQVLSQRRAASVRQYLIKKGIEPARMEAVGYGESKPIATNDTEEGRQTNRRTVVTILKE